MYGLVARDSRRIDRALMARAARELELEPPRSGFRATARGALLVVALLLAVGLLFFSAERLTGFPTPLVQLLRGEQDSAAEVGAAAVTQTGVDESPAVPPAAVLTAAPQVDSSTGVLAASRAATDATATDAETAARWSRFLMAFPGLEWPTEMPRDRRSALRAFPAVRAAGLWLPLLLPGDTKVNCQARPAFALADGSLTLFSSALPVEPIPFATQGESVRLLQQALVDYRFLHPDAVDAVMGPRTAAALARFQSQQSLFASGQPDVATAYLLSCTPQEVSQR